MILNVGRLASRLGTDKGAGFKMIGRAQAGLEEKPVDAQIIENLRPKL